MSSLDHFARCVEDAQLAAKFLGKEPNEMHCRTRFHVVKDQDKVIQYQTHLIVNDSKRKRSTTTEYWTDYLFSEKPARPGSWKYEIDYRGRGGSLDKYEIHYDKQAERFEGKLVATGGE